MGKYTSLLKLMEMGVGWQTTTGTHIEVALG